MHPVQKLDDEAGYVSQESYMSDIMDDIFEEIIDIDIEQDSSPEKEPETLGKTANSELDKLKTENLKLKNELKKINRNYKSLHNRHIQISKELQQHRKLRVHNCSRARESDESSNEIDMNNNSREIDEKHAEQTDHNKVGENEQKDKTEALKEEILEMIKTERKEITKELAKMEKNLKNEIKKTKQTLNQNRRNEHHGMIDVNTKERNRLLTLMNTKFDNHCNDVMSCINRFDKKDKLLEKQEKNSKEIVDVNYDILTAMNFKIDLIYDQTLKNEEILKKRLRKKKKKKDYRWDCVDLKEMFFM